MSDTPKAASGRLAGLDAWRGVCVWMMLLYHAVYDLTLFGAVPKAAVENPAARLYCLLGAGGFVLLSGVCVRLSKNPVRRGFLVFCAGAAVTAVTTLAGYPVAFGVLSLLGCCMMLCGALRRFFAPRIGPAFAAGCLALFALSWAVTAAIRVDITFLYPLGLRSAGFASADYFPLFPWAFLFFAGTGLSPLILRHAGSARCPRALIFCGRHSLVIYLLHQPLFYGICRLLFVAY